MDTAVVRLEHVTKRFGQVVAVDDLNLSIETGEFVTFLGPSGCGKSTTLRLLGGFEVPDAGRIMLADRDVTHVPPNRRDVNMVFQDYALFPHMTVARNIAFGLELQGRRKAEIAERITVLLDFLELGPLRDRRPEQLSGGQRQRVALARALAPDPKVLLLDEPLGALDAKLRGQVQIELKAIQQRTGKTFVFVTHDQEEALTMSDRVVVMHGGRVEQVGTPETLYHHPVNHFVADFIGETNLLSCTVKGEETGCLVLDWNGAELRARASGHRPRPGATVATALRPESIVCSEHRPEDGNILRGRIVRRLFKGRHTRVDISIDGRDDLLIQASLDPFVGDRLTDDHLWIAWPPHRMSVLRD